MPHDEVRDNVERVKFEIPREWQNKYDAYTKTMSKVLAPKQTPAASSKTGQ